jgi:hypothetical protein
LFVPPAPAGGLPAVRFNAGGVSGVATTQTAADAVVNTRENDSLANEADFQTSHNSDGPETTGMPAVRFFVRPLDFAEGARGRPIDPKPAAKDRLAAAKRMGFDGVRAIGGMVNFAGPVCDWELQAAALANKPFRKSMRLLSLTPGQLPTLPNWLAVDFSSVWLLRMDFPTAMQGFANLYDEVNEPGPDGEGLFDDVLNGLRDDPEGVRVDLRKDVFAVLGPEAVRVNYEDGWLYSIALQDPPRVLSALTRFYQNDKRVKHEATTDYELWTVGAGASLFVEGQGAKTLSIRGIAIKGKELFVGLDPDRVRAALEARDKPPMSVTLFKEAGPNTAARGLLQMDRVVGPAYRTAITGKSDAESDLLTNVWRALLFGKTDRLDKPPYAAAPPFDRLRSGFSRSGALVSAGDDGFTIRLGAPRHADEK